MKIKMDGEYLSWYKAYLSWRNEYDIFLTIKKIFPDLKKLKYSIIVLDKPIMSNSTTTGSQDNLLLENKSGIPWKFYLSRFLSAWGDRMWSFGGGVFLTIIDKSGTLRLVAIYGFVLCISVIFFGAIIGNWIDRLEWNLEFWGFLISQLLPFDDLSHLRESMHSDSDKFQSHFEIIC